MPIGREGNVEKRLKTCFAKERRVSRQHARRINQKVLGCEHHVVEPLRDAGSGDARQDTVVERCVRHVEAASGFECKVPESHLVAAEELADVPGDRADPIGKLKVLKHATIQISGDLQRDPFEALDRSRQQRPHPWTERWPAGGGPEAWIGRLP